MAGSAGGHSYWPERRKGAERVKKGGWSGSATDGGSNDGRAGRAREAPGGATARGSRMGGGASPLGGLGLSASERRPRV